MPLWMVLIIAIRDIIVTILRSYDEYKGLIIKTSGIAKIKTFIQMFYIFFVFAILLYSSENSDSVLKLKIDEFLFHSVFNYILMLLVTLLTLYTGISYFIEKKYYVKNEIY